jgi:2-oxoglutarate dehydrogenase E2 component (dihydrolipoamide succinyltransferase)
MSVLEMKVPSPGESISEVEIATWLVKDGDYVEKDQAIAEVDSDKATLELPAEASGVITLKAAEGDAVKVGAVVCLIDTSAKKPEGHTAPAKAAVAVEAGTAAKATEAKKESAPKAETKTVAVPANGSDKKSHAAGTPSVAAGKMMAEKGLTGSQIKATGKGGRITKQDVLAALSAGVDASSVQGWGGTRNTDAQKMSMLRRKVAERLVSVKNETAMLTTFNEVNMKPIMDLREKYKKTFGEKHDVGLGFMSFFTKACTEALNIFPAVNARLEDKEIIYHDYADVGIAVSSPKGLMVPVVRNAEQMSIAEIEREIKRLAIRARDGEITPDEMTGGTFTITNGGVFGSMLSTPIINPPQSAILGMHNIVDRAVVIDGQIVVRPVMYVALSYDHRIIDGKESVSFLVKVKEMLENPERMIFGGKDPVQVLLGL